MRRRRFFTTTLLVLSMMVATPLVGLSGSASAVTKGSPGWCAAHPAKAKKLAACAAGGEGGGTGGPPPVITVQVDPNPLVETGPSEVLGVIQVETSPSFAGDPVDISSSQLAASCGANSLVFDDLQGPGDAKTAFYSFFNGTAQVILDDDGNAMIDVFATDCAPGTDLIEADLGVAPFDTALGTLVAAPPVVTPVGLTGYPSTSGTVTTGEVETGDTAASGDSDVFAVFYVETDPVYAEQTVEISSAQLESRCLRGWIWFGGADGGPTGIGISGTLATTTIDDDGNAVFEFVGVSCAAGPSAVIADVEAGTHPTYTTTFTINPPAPTI